MRTTRGATLAGLVLVAVAAPAAAYALDGAIASPSGSVATHHDKEKDKKKDQEKSGHTGRERADEASAAGRAHAKAMQAWAKCVAKAASGPKTERTGPPKETCGEKPLGPGKARHQADAGKHEDQKPKKDNGHRR